MCKTSKKSLIKDINGLAEKEKEAKKGDMLVKFTGTFSNDKRKRLRTFLLIHRILIELFHRKTAWYQTKRIIYSYNIASISF